MSTQAPDKPPVGASKPAGIISPRPVRRSREGSSGRFVLISAILLLAQPFFLAAQQVVSGLDIQVIDLDPHPSPSELASARNAYRHGHIIRIVGGQPQDLQRLLGAGIARVTGQNTLTEFPKNRRGSAKTLSPSNLQMQVVAARVDEAGVLHQYYGLSAPGSPDGGNWEARFNDWRDQLNTVKGGTPFPPPPQGAWTLLQSITFSGSDTSGNVSQQTVEAFRLNVVASDPNNPPPDQYLVVEQPQSQPNWGGWNNCLVGCGWFTTKRNFTLSSSPQAVLSDHQPINQITTSNSSFTLGGNVGPTGPGISAGYTFSWSQPSVTTTDQSSLSSGYGQWLEQFTGSGFLGKLPPATSTGPFYSYSGVIFQVPAGTSELAVSIQSNYNFEYDGCRGGFDTCTSSIALNENLSLLAPQFVASPSELDIPAGGEESITLIARIPSSTQGLPWVISNYPGWLTVSQTQGAGPAQLTLAVQPGTPVGSTASLNIDTNPSFAAPSVETNPLIVAVTVGQPSRSFGVVLAGGSAGSANLGVDPLGVGEIYNLPNGQHSQTVPMVFTRWQHTATLLPNGKILLAGGYGAPNGTGSQSPDVLATAELFDPGTDTFSAVNGAVSCPGASGCMNSKRTDHSGTLLSNGQVLIAGGSTVLESNANATTELFDPATGTFNAAANMTAARTGHSATLLANGDVLFVGGVIYYLGPVVATSEIYHVSTGTFTPTVGQINTPRSDHTATLLPSGEVLITGGYSGLNGADLNSAELFNPATGTFTSIGNNMNNARADATATLLDDGTVLIAGGYDSNQNALATAEIFNPETQTFTLLSGSNSCPGSSGCLANARAFHAATLLPGGEVLLSGGDTPLVAVGSTEIYNPQSRNFTLGASILPSSGVTATVMQKLATTITVESSANPSTTGESVTFTAAVNSSPASARRVSARAGNPTGTVTFKDGTATLGTGTLNGGQATFSTASLALGPHPITAVYAGDTEFQGSTSTAFIQTVGPNTTTTALVSSANPSAYQQPVTFTATVNSPSGGTPTGSVSFHDGGSTLGIVTLSGNQASLPTSSLSGGTHSITASYLGNNTFGGSTSPALSQVVQLEATSTTLTSAPNPSTYLQTVTFSATVTAASGAPTGTVAFHEGSTLIGPKQNIVNGQASLTTTQLAAGPHSIAATYSGDINFQSSTSPIVQQVVQAVKSSTTFSNLTASQAIPFGTGNVNLSGVISAPGPAFPPANENVTVTVGSVQRQVNIGAKGAFSFNNFPTGTLAAGTYTITYSYAGDTNFNGASNSSTALTVNKVTPVFSSLTGSQTITFGTASISLSGQIAANRLFPTGSISITINGASTTAPIGANGAFSASFDTHAVPASTTPYQITYTYGGDSNFNTATNAATTLTVNGGGAVQTTTTLTPSVQTCVTGSDFILTVAVAPVPPATGVPDGQVVLVRKNPDGTTTGVGTQFLTNGIWAPAFAGMAPGKYTFVASYEGTQNFGASQGKANLTCKAQ